jgi:hypothetical protein
MNPDGGSGTAPFPERPDFASRARAHAPALPEMLRKLRTADHLLSCCLTARQIWSVGAPSRQAPKARRGGAAYKSSPTSKGATTHPPPSPGVDGLGPLKSPSPLPLLPSLSVGAAWTELPQCGDCLSALPGLQTLSG